MSKDIPSGKGGTSKNNQLMSLATNWRGTGGLAFCSRSGDDATGDGSNALPYLTFDGRWGVDFRLRGQFILGASQDLDAASAVRKIIQGDGYARIEGNGFNFNVGGNSPRYFFRDIAFEGCNFNFSGSQRRLGFESCIISNSTITDIAYASDYPFDSCIVNTCSINSSLGLSLCRPNKSTFYNSDFTGEASLTYCALLDCTFDNDDYTLENSAVSNLTIDGTLVENLTLDGDIDTIGNTYADGEKFSGTFTGVGYTITFTDTFYSADLGFLDVAKGDFRIDPTSLLLNNLTIIGSEPVGVHFDSNNNAFDPANSGVGYTNVTRNTVDGSFDLTAPAVEGTVTSTDDPSLCLTLPFAVRVDRAVQIFGTFLYGQGEWIDKENYDPGVNDEVRLTLEIQVYDENEPNGAGSPTNFSDWIEVEAQTPFEVDAAGLGNGNVNADMTALSGIVGKRFRVRFTIRTNGV